MRISLKALQTVGGDRAHVAWVAHTNRIKQADEAERGKPWQYKLLFELPSNLAPLPDWVSL